MFYHEDCLGDADVYLPPLRHAAVVVLRPLLRRPVRPDVFLFNRMPRPLVLDLGHESTFVFRRIRSEAHSAELTVQDEFLILAGDGVWAVLTNQQAASYVHRRLLTHWDVKRAAVELMSDKKR